MSHVPTLAIVDAPAAVLAPWIDAALAGLGAAARGADDEIAVATVDGAPAGIARIRALGGGDGDLDVVFVAAPFRGRGIGRSLAAHVVDASRHRRVFGVRTGPSP